MDDEKKTPPGGTHTAAGPPRADAIASLWQSALGQIDEIRDAIVRGSQAGKAKIDVQILKRQRDKLLMQIGEAVIHEGALPASCEELAARVADVDKQIADADSEAQKMFRKTS